MKAVICTRYGSPDVLKLKEIAKPVPKANQLLIKIMATSVTAADYRIRSLSVPTGFRFLMQLALGFRKPRQAIPGMNFSGVVEAIGKDVTQYAVGDPVFGSSGAQQGTYAEYICLAEKASLTTKPDVMSHEEAAAFPFGALTALSFLKDKGAIKAGQKVLVYGASGAVGTAAIQIARYYGTEVTGICSTPNLEMVKNLGAHHIIDYTREDITHTHTHYDIIFDTVGKMSISQSKKLLTPQGRYLTTVAGLPQYGLLFWHSITGRQKFMGGMASERLKDLIFLKSLVEAGQLTTVIDRHYPLKQIVQAHAYAETGRKKGNIVILLPSHTTCPATQPEDQAH